MKKALIGFLAVIRFFSWQAVARGQGRNQNIHNGSKWGFDGTGLHL